MGLVVTRGIAELANVLTPNMDLVIVWCQKMMGKEYLVGGKLIGHDLHSTRAPQRYGFTDLDDFMATNHYCKQEGITKATPSTISADAPNPATAQ